MAALVTVAAAPGQAAGHAIAAQAKAGALQASGADLRDTVELGGEWELYWGRLLEPADFAAGTPGPHRLIKVPRSWTDPANGFPSVGAATYRLQVTLPDTPSEPLGLYVKNIATAYRLYCNGVLLAENGTVSTRAEETRGTYAPRTVFFEARDRVDIVLQVSNAEEPKAGMDTAPILGLQSSIEPVGSRETLLDAIIYAFVLAMGLYHVLLSLIHPEEKASLYFGLLAIDLALRGALTGSRILH